MTYGNELCDGILAAAREWGVPEEMLRRFVMVTIPDFAAGGYDVTFFGLAR